MRETMRIANVAEPAFGWPLWRWRLSLRPRRLLPGNRRPSDWVGKAVVPKGRDFTLKDAQKGSQVKGPPEIYHVSQVSGKSVLLSTAGFAGWAPIDQVVPLEQADSFFTNQIRANPGESFNHTMRAIVSLAHNGDLDRALGDLNEAIRLAPREADNYLIRAEVWRARGDPAKALADCDAVLRLDPKSVARSFSGRRSGPTARSTTRRSPITARSFVAIRRSSRLTSAARPRKAKRGRSTRRSPTWAPPFT